MINQARQELILKEARIHARLEHHAILQIYASGVDATTSNIFIVMPKMAKSLDHVKPPLKPDEILYWITPVAEGLGYIHSQKILHRDLKPGNILIADDGRVMLADFGLAKDLQQGSLTVHKAGTGLFMAPEQWEVTRLSPATDVYALGVIVYYFLTGEFPFGNNPGLCVQKEPNSLPLKRISPAIAEVVLKALARNPTHRTESAIIFISDLQKAVSKTKKPILDMTFFLLYTLTGILMGLFYTWQGSVEYGFSVGILIIGLGKGVVFGFAMGVFSFLYLGSRFS